MSGKVLEIQGMFDRDTLAADISDMYTRWDDQREPWISEKKEIRDYIFATDTTKTANAALPWKNKTTVPKLCQIRDNLHANYLSALFPNDEWMKWEGYTKDSDTKLKKDSIQAYLSNKTRESGLRTEIAKLLYDYIDYGNAFAEVVFEENYVENEKGEKIPGYIGPKLYRISPYDIVFNPTATSFSDSPKIIRKIKTLGELLYEAKRNPDMGYIDNVMKKIVDIRKATGGYRIEDFDKAVGYSVDGFGNMYEYLQSGYVELLEFDGTIADMEGNVYEDHIITIVDRTWVVRMEKNKSWLGSSNKVHVGWRLRPDNLYAMGPLDNLVGMQYRLDHLENLKADAMDLSVWPPLKIKGDVDEFEYGPGEEIFCGDDGDVEELGKNLNGVIAAESEMERLEARMEEMAGAPKQAMGIRTPGEKTAFEVQTLDNAAGRIFQDKITNFEIELLEPVLNMYLEAARRNMNAADTIRVMDDDLGVTQFLQVTKEDITATGKIRPIGARHFAARNQFLQNTVGVFNTPIGQMIAPHVSSKSMAKFVEEFMGWERFGLIQDNVAIMEQAETQRLVNQIQEDLQVEQQVPTEGAPVPIETE